MTSTQTALKVVSRAEWLAARKTLLRREKEFTRQRDALSAERRRLPMVRVEEEYTFEGPGGPRTLRELFGTQRQLIIYQLHVRPRLGGGLQELLAPHGQRRWQHRPPRRARYVLRGRLPCAASEDRGVQGAHGMGLPLALLVRQQFQLRLRGHPRPREGRVRVQLRRCEGPARPRQDLVPEGGAAGPERLHS